MNKKTVYLIAIILGTVETSAETLLFDDFNDSQLADDRPVSWTSIFGPDTLTARSGDVLLANSHCCAGFGWSKVIEGDVSIQAQGRLIEGNFGIAAKFGGGNGNDGYYLQVSESGSLFFLSRVGGVEGDEKLVFPGIDVPRDEDIYLQLDVVDNQVFGWYWPQTADIPEFPQLEYTLGDRRIIDDGQIGFYTGEGKVRLRYAKIGDSPIPVNELPSTHLFRDDFDTEVTLDRWRGGNGADDALSIGRERLFVEQRGNISAWVDDFEPTDVSLSTSFQVHDGDFTWATLIGRSEGDPNATLYGGSSGEGRATLGMSIGNQITILAEAPTVFDATTDEVSLQMDIHDDRMRLWMWDAEQPRPDRATLVTKIPDNYPNDRGSTGFFYNPNGGSQSVSLDFFEASEVEVLPGDIDFDNVLTIRDIDSLCSALSGNSVDLDFDVNGDGSVNEIDLDEFLRHADTVVGDVDLNGSVEFSDFLVLSSRFGTPSSGWTRGDFDCNGRTEFADFLALSQNFGVTSSTTASHTVPEPTGSGTAVLVFWLVFWSTVHVRIGQPTRSRL